MGTVIGGEDTYPHGVKRSIVTPAWDYSSMTMTDEVTVCGQPMPDAAELTKWQTRELGRLRAAVDGFGKAIDAIYMDKCVASGTEAQCENYGESYIELLDAIDAELTSRGISVPAPSPQDWRTLISECIERSDYR